MISHSTKVMVLAALFSGLRPEASAQPLHPGGSANLVLGKAGSVFIPEEEFTRRFELLPGLYRRQNRLNEEKLMVMYSLIAEKLLAQEAEARGIDRDTPAVEGMRWLTELISRDELYRKEIAEKVQISSEEVQKGVRDAVRKLLVRYLYFPKKTDAERVAAETEGKSLDAVSPDSTTLFLKDTVTIIWGAAEPEVEEAAFALKPGVASPVVVSSKGSLILQLVSEEPNRFYAGMQPSVLLERVRDRLRLVKEKARLEDFLAGFLAGKRGYAVGPVLKTLARAVSRDLVYSASDSMYTLPVQASRDLEERLEPVLNDTCLVAGDRVFTVKSVIGMLTDGEFGLPSNEPLRVAGEISSRCEVWVRQELLAQEALRRGLQDRPQVTKQLKEWRESYLAELMRSRVEDSISVTDVDVYRYRELNGDPLPTPRIRVRTLTTAAPEAMRQALGDLARGAGFSQVIRTYSDIPAEKSNGGDSGWFPITERPPIGELSLQMKVGQMYGPVPLRRGLLLFQLVDRSDSASVDTGIASSKRRSAEALARLMKKQALDRFIAESAARRGFSVFEDRLRALKVSPVPMMSFRVMGFGGRLFAAPMLPRPFDWVGRPELKSGIAP